MVKDRAIQFCENVHFPFVLRDHYKWSQVPGTHFMVKCFLYSCIMGKNQIARLKVEVLDDVSVVLFEMDCSLNARGRVAQWAPPSPHIRKYVVKGSIPKTTMWKTI